MKIVIEEFDKHIDYLREIDKVKASDLQIYENGKLLNIPDRIIDDFDFIGLDTSDFVRDRYWEGIKLIPKYEINKLKEYVIKGLSERLKCTNMHARMVVDVSVFDEIVKHILDSQHKIALDIE